MIAKAPSLPGIGDIRRAAGVLEPYIARSPLLPFQADVSPGEIFLKLENLQPIGAFKIRPMGNVLLGATASQLGDGVYTASSGNAGLGLAWMAKSLRLDARVYAPQSSPRDKLAAITRLGAGVVTVSDDEWWQMILRGGHANDPGLYVDAVRDPRALAGNGTIGLEIAAQCPAVDTVLVPFGGGGLSSGIAAAMKTLRPATRIVVAECDTAAPLTAALQAGRPVTVDMRSTFITGAGASTVLEEMWPLVNELVDDTVVVSIGAVADAVERLYRCNKVIAEGAGALALAAALKSGSPAGSTVCVVSGGNIDSGIMASILQGGAG